MTNPIEIRPEDIKKRPASTELDSTGSFVKQARGIMQNIKELKELADELGFGDFFKMPGKQGKKEGDGSDGSTMPATTTKNQVTAFIKLLRAVYGDISINEVVDNLRRDFGSYTLGDLLEGRLRDKLP